MPWRVYCRLSTALVIERRGLALGLAHVPSITHHQIVLRDHTVLFLVLSHFSGRSGSVCMIAGGCDRALKYHNSSLVKWWLALNMIELSWGGGGGGVCKSPTTFLVSFPNVYKIMFIDIKLFFFKDFNFKDVCIMYMYLTRMSWQGIRGGVYSLLYLK